MYEKKTKIYRFVLVSFTVLCIFGQNYLPVQYLFTLDAKSGQMIDAFQFLACHYLGSFYIPF